ncbi:calcium-binding protein [Kordiimonas sp. SCSIO 12610]|uniref:calcium-binding protein n=1 Tax=Kordiimonas sp. SCSIO 12610 TaxID=2829597 RepID=UPI002109ADB5|nr:calcium-binding protein [Kordiimonas sp. SCSIO 12610]UTW56214.1 calcium-binding protein [Kordiimonas sp. SCSIO 12610]
MITWQVIRNSTVATSGVSTELLNLIESLIIQAGEFWARYLDPVTDVTLTIDFGFIDEEGGTLAEAGSSFGRIGTTDDGEPLFQIATITELATGVDPFSTADITLSFNLANLDDIYFDPDITTVDDLPSNLNDGFSILLHEIGHGLGFLGFIDTPADLDDPDNVISVYDQLVRFDGNIPFFTGANARASFGGDVPLTPDDPSHLGNPNDPNDPLTGPGGDILQPFAVRGVRESISSLNIAVLQDVGIPVRTASSSANELFGFELENDTIDGLEGNDTLDGLGGNDTLRGGEGDDQILGNGGNDFISSGLGDDLATGGDGDDQIFAGVGDVGADTVIGGAGNDTLGGGGGNDLVIGGGSNVIDGIDAGAITLAGANTLFGGSGDDTLLGGGFDDANGNGQYDVGEEVISVAGVNTIFAGTGNDRIAGAAGNDILGGGTGDDTLRGGDGNDTFFGGQGDASDTGRNDVISAGNGNDTVFSGAGNDDIDGGFGDDELFNGAGNDTVRGNLGDDTIFGGADDDRLSGNGGADTFAFFDGNGNDTIIDFSVAEDTLDLNGTEIDFTDLASVEAAASNTTQGGVAGLLIDTGTGDSIFLEGLTTADLASINIIF